MFLDMELQWQKKGGGRKEILRTQLSCKAFACLQPSVSPQHTPHSNILFLPLPLKWEDCNVSQHASLSGVFLKSYLMLIMCVCVSVRVCTCEFGCPRGQKPVSESPGAGVTGVAIRLSWELGVVQSLNHWAFSPALILGVLRKGLCCLDWLRTHTI